MAEKKSSSKQVVLSLGFSLFFIYLAYFKPHFGALFSGEESIVKALFGSVRFDFAELGKVIARAEWIYIGIAGLIFFVTLLLRAWRWKLMLNTLTKIPFSQVFGAMNIGYMANNVLPLRLGEVYRAQVVHKLCGISRSAAFGTIVLERLVDLIYMVPFIVLALVLYPLPPFFQKAAYAASAGAIALGGFCVWIGLDRPRAMSFAEKILSIFPKNFADRIHEGLNTFASGLGVFARRDLFWKFALSSSFMWVMYSSMVYLVMRALGLTSLEVPLIANDVLAATLVILIVTTLGFVIPGAPGAVGTYHGVAILGLSLFGVAGDQAAGFAIMLHALNFLPLTILGLIFFWTYGLSFKKTVELAVNES